MFGLGTQEIMLLLVLGILLFGRNLPQLGRSVGKTFVEFKKGMHGLEEEMETPGARRTQVDPEPMRPPQRVTASAPKFDDSPASSSAATPPTRIS